MFGFLRAHRAHCARLSVVLTCVVTQASLASALVASPLGAQGARSGPRFEISFTPAAHAAPITGRVYVAISRTNDGPRTPIMQTGETGTPLFGVNIDNVAAGKAVVIDASTFGHPVRSLTGIPAGEYWVQPFVNVYTKFARADGHTVWLHNDQWEGQNWKRSPGNIFGDPVKISFDPKSSTPIRLVADKVIPPIVLPAETENVKRIKIQIVYDHGHFSLRAPRVGSDPAWNADGTPRMIIATVQHPSPYYDDSYGVNSENNGPYGDAITQELMPAVEAKFRVIGQPWARLLTGGSTATPMRTSLTADG